MSRVVSLYLPTWQIEGLATYEESVITGEGRLHAGDFRAIVRPALVMKEKGVTSGRKIIDRIGLNHNSDFAPGLPSRQRPPENSFRARKPPAVTVTSRVTELVTPLPIRMRDVAFAHSAMVE